MCGAETDAEVARAIRSARTLRRASFADQSPHAALGHRDVSFILVQLEHGQDFGLGSLEGILQLFNGLTVLPFLQLVHNAGFDQRIMSFH